MRKFIPGLILLLSSALFVSCVSARSAGTDISFGEETAGFIWEELSDGITYARHRQRHQGADYSVVRINLTEPALETVAYPVHIPPEGGTGHGIKVRDFARRNGCIAALNASPFDIPGTSTAAGRLLSRKREIIGIHKVNGREISAPQEKYACLALKENPDGTLTARIFPHQGSDVTEDFQWAFGGFFQVLSEGQKIKFAERYDFRTAAGTADGGAVLYILAGKKLSYGQCADILLALGCSDAMEFDGGSSGCLYTKNFTQGSALTVANAFGFRARAKTQEE